MVSMNWAVLGGVNLRRRSGGKPYALFGVEIGIRDANNRKLPHDGKAVGDLVVRGPWIARAYYKMPESERVICRLRIARRTSSSPEANGYRLSNSKTWRWPTPKSSKRR